MALLVVWSPVDWDMTKSINLELTAIHLSTQHL